MRGSRSSGGCKEVEESFHKPIDLVPSQLALTVHSIDKADWHLGGRVDHNLRKAAKSHLADSEAELPRPDHHFHLEDIALGHSCSYQPLQNLEKTHQVI